MSVINYTASAVNLAKSWKMSVDPTRITTEIPTATLLLLLNSLIELGDGKSEVADKAAEIQARAVSQRTAAVQSAIKDRDT